MMRTGFQLMLLLAIHGTDPCLRAGCPEGWPGDGYCDSKCNIYECSYDGGDCSGSNSSNSSSSNATEVTPEGCAAESGPEDYCGDAICEQWAIDTLPSLTREVMNFLCSPVTNSDGDTCLVASRNGGDLCGDCKQVFIDTGMQTQEAMNFLCSTATNSDGDICSDAYKNAGYTMSGDLCGCESVVVPFFMTQWAGISEFMTVLCSTARGGPQNKLCRHAWDDFTSDDAGRGEGEDSDWSHLCGGCEELGIAYISEAEYQIRDQCPPSDSCAVPNRGNDPKSYCGDCEQYLIDASSSFYTREKMDLVCSADEGETDEGETDEAVADLRASPAATTAVADLRGSLAVAVVAWICMGRL